MSAFHTAHHGVKAKKNGALASAVAKSVVKALAQMNSLIKFSRYSWPPLVFGAASPFLSM